MFARLGSPSCLRPPRACTKATLLLLAGAPKSKPGKVLEKRPQPPKQENRSRVSLQQPGKHLLQGFSFKTRGPDPCPRHFRVKI